MLSLSLSPNWRTNVDVFLPATYQNIIPSTESPIQPTFFFDHETATIPSRDSSVASACSDVQPQGIPPREERTLECTFAFPPKEGSPSESASLSTPRKPTVRKRGRPRLDITHVRRIPHNEVERKYRHSLNEELERLRRAVPTLPRGEDDEDVAMQRQRRPSKAMVLMAAVEYIKKIEKERDTARQMLEQLRTISYQ